MKIKIPTIIEERYENIKVDPNNPNVMSEDKLEALKKNIKRFGFLIPIITNKDLVIADGHQRFEAGKQLGMTEFPIMRLDLEEVDRKIIQQVMNKLRGTHAEDKDSEIFKFLEENDKIQDLAELLGEDEADFIENYIEEIEPAKVEQIEKLGKLTVECPKCGHKFERANK